MEHYNRHYITTGPGGLITDGWSDGPHRERDPTGGICINEEGGYQFRLQPDGEENPPRNLSEHSDRVVYSYFYPHADNHGVKPSIQIRTNTPHSIVRGCAWPWRTDSHPFGRLLLHFD